MLCFQGRGGGGMGVNIIEAFTIQSSYADAYVHTYTHMQIHIHTYANTYIYKYIHIQIHTYTNTYIYKYICIYIHIQIHMQTSVKFLGITFDSALTFKSHYHTLANIARHHLLNLNSIFTSTYGPSTSTLIRLYKSYIHSLFDYGAPATCVASPHVQRIWEGFLTHFIMRALSIPRFFHNNRKRQHAYLPPIHDRNLYLAKRWYRHVMLHNSGVQDYVDNHTQRSHTYRQPQYTTQTDQELIFK